MPLTVNKLTHMKWSDATYCSCPTEPIAAVIHWGGGGELRSYYRNLISNYTVQFNGVCEKFPPHHIAASIVQVWMETIQR